MPKATKERTEQLLASRRFNIFIVMLILISVASFAYETLPNLSDEVRHWLFLIEAFIVAVFIIEYGLRLYCADRKIAFVFSAYGLIDLLAILPFFLATSLDLRSLRLLRLLRFLTALKLLRYNAAMMRFARAIHLARYELLIFTIGSLIVLFIAAVGIYHFEHQAQPQVFRSLFDALWWGVASLTTVGYGDIYPITVGGKVFTFFVLMTGLGLVAVPTGILASSLNQVRQDDRSRNETDDR